jgi:hypothetical protein
MKEAYIMDKQVVKFIGNELMVWESTKTSVYYRPNLNGFGSIEAEWYVNFIKKRFPNKVFRKAFEWCSGPGFIGFALLDAGICEKLCLADINKNAIECIKMTIDKNPNLQNRVSYYVSDNLKQVPKDERFDLVVGNPPYALNINPKVSPGVSDDLRPNDPEWKIHQEFYLTIREHLYENDSYLCISEFAPFEKSPSMIISNKITEPWDFRQRMPIIDFYEHITKGGLELIEVIRGETTPYLMHTPIGMAPVDKTDWFWILVSKPKS